VDGRTSGTVTVILKLMENIFFTFDFLAIMVIPEKNYRRMHNFYDYFLLRKTFYAAVEDSNKTLKLNLN